MGSIKAWRLTSGLRPKAVLREAEVSTPKSALSVRAVQVPAAMSLARVRRLINQGNTAERRQGCSGIQRHALRHNERIAWQRTDKTRLLPLNHSLLCGIQSDFRNS